MKNFDLLKQNDPEVYRAVMDEANRQKNKIELIASENFVSETVMEANGTPLTNKYAEGYPGKRYYGGCEHVDVVEEIAIRYRKQHGAGQHKNRENHTMDGAVIGQCLDAGASGAGESVGDQELLQRSQPGA
ncbi:MAG: hypothetical protein IIX21_00115 [Clostridia bacterium]|nr:hypothetical protein [Clostridia bacterium]